MSDEANKKTTPDPTPRVVKGTGFYTPMDLAPGESPSEVSTPSPAVVGETIGLPTPMNVAPPTPTPPAPEPQQASDGGNNADAD